METMMFRIADHLESLQTSSVNEILSEIDAFPLN